MIDRLTRLPIDIRPSPPPQFPPRFEQFHLAPTLHQRHGRGQPSHAAPHDSDSLRHRSSSLLPLLPSVHPPACSVSLCLCVRNETRLQACRVKCASRTRDLQSTASAPPKSPPAAAARSSDRAQSAPESP